MTENDCLYCGGEKTCRHHLTGRDLEDVYLDPDLWGRLCGSCHPLLHEDWNTADVGDRTSPATFLDSLYLRLRRTALFLGRLAPALPAPFDGPVARLAEALALWAVQLAATLTFLDSTSPTWRTTRGL
jgi:hypothetical protein